MAKCIRVDKNTHAALARLKDDDETFETCSRGCSASTTRTVGLGPVSGKGATHPSTHGRRVRN